ncbi:hypothetical protein Barb7_01512 [Bacteroidales bacterium Barb7]|nr:hypothetical protein Barb7_01512 [Bacteroidales bacterium Barb7]
MTKKKFHIEYVFNKVSRRSLWNHLVTTSGLSAWFADDVSTDAADTVYTFKWGKDEQVADVILMRPEVSVRYHWQDEEDGCYFEFRIHTIELTGTTALEITDFAEPDEKADAISLWDTQVKKLKRMSGI